MEQFVLAIDPIEKKVGCVLLQAAYGTDYQSFNFETLFPVETWVLHPTPNLGLYRCDMTTLKRISSIFIEEAKVK